MKSQRGALTGKSLAILLIIAVAIAVAAAAFIGSRPDNARPDNDRIVKPPEEIDDYLFWEA